MYTREKVAEVFLKAAARTFQQDYDTLAGNLQTNLHDDLHMESMHTLVIVAAVEEEFDYELDADDFTVNVTTLDSAIDYIYKKVNE